MEFCMFLYYAPILAICLQLHVPSTVTYMCYIHVHQSSGHLKLCISVICVSQIFHNVLKNTIGRILH